MSLLNKYNSDVNHGIEYEPLEIQQYLSYIEQPVEIIDCKENELRNMIMPFVRVLWRNPKVEESTWNLKSEMRKMYPHLFTYVRFWGHNSFKGEHDVIF